MFMSRRLASLSDDEIENPPLTFVCARLFADCRLRSHPVERTQKSVGLRRLTLESRQVDAVLPRLEAAQLVFAAEIFAAGQHVGGEPIVIVGFAPPGRVADLGAVERAIFIHALIGLGAREDEETLTRHPAAGRTTGG